MYSLHLISQNRMRFIITCILIALYLTHLMITFSRSSVIDDAFITYRYAYNFADGNGLVYNIGENVLGTTTPGYALFIGILATILGKSLIPLISITVNLIAIILLMVVLAIAVYRLSTIYYLAILSPLLVIVSRPTIFEISTGMETSIFLLLITSAITLIIYRHWRIASLIAGLTIWIRPEGVFLIGLVGLTVLFMAMRRQLSWKKFIISVAGLVIPAIVYFIMLITIYGTYLPQSIVSKVSGLYEIPFTQQVVKVGPQIASPFILIVELLYGAEDVSAIILLASTLIIALFAITIGTMQLIKLDKVLWIIPAFFFINVVFYLSRSTLLFHWYHANYHLAATILMVFGIGHIIYSIAKTISEAHKLTITLITCILIFVVPTVATIPYLELLNEEPQDNFANERTLYYRQLLDDVGEQIPIDAVIATPEIGYLGFRLIDYYILDTAGLVSPQVVDYFPVPLEERENIDWYAVIPKDAIFDIRPDVIITFDIFSRAGLYQASWFDETYDIVYSIDDLDVLSSITDLDLMVLKARQDEITIGQE